ncbi:hypothetical protein LCGC14_0441610 [marine sediment metagenome]|uniref:Uncharacterized protein n=1 Tax=marine sediment metagenome TaxID=412755 RepID=A0A0F9VUB1_9ZZZZ
MKTEDFEFVKVDWLDAQSGFSVPMDLEELMSVPMVETTSVGCLVHEDKEKIVLGFMMFGKEGYFKHWQMIPRGMIKKITKLKEMK